MDVSEFMRSFPPSQKSHAFSIDLSIACANLREANDYGWPAPRVVLQLQLFAALFPLSDRRHPVATPLALLTGAYLALCPPSCSRHALIGLLLASAATHAAAAGARMAPEPLGFAARLVAGAAAGVVLTVMRKEGGGRIYYIQCCTCDC